MVCEVWVYLRIILLVKLSALQFFIEDGNVVVGIFEAVLDYLVGIS